MCVRRCYAHCSHGLPRKDRLDRISQQDDNLGVRCHPRYSFGDVGKTHVDRARVKDHVLGHSPHDFVPPLSEIGGEEGGVEPGLFRGA